MKLQEKTSLILIVMLILSITVISLFVSAVSLSSYSALEDTYIARDVSQARNTLHEEASTLSAIVSDWAPWDDTYSFVEGKKPEYVAVNLLPETYENLRVDLILILNARGDLVYGGSYDRVNRTIRGVPSSMLLHTRPGDPLMDMSDIRNGTDGILLTSEGAMIVASRPIVHTDLSGTPQGVVIMARYLDDAEIGRIARLTSPSIRLVGVNDTSLPPHLLDDLHRGTTGSPGIVRILSKDEAGGYTLLQDIYGRDALILRIVQYRDIYQQGVTTTLEYILIVLASGLFLGVVTLYVLDRLVLSRIMDLSTQVSGIGDKTDISKRLVVRGNDEFAGLASEINRMLLTIEKTQRGLQLSEVRFRELTELLPQIIFEMNTEGNLTYVNKAGVDQFGLTETVIHDGANIRQYLSPDNIGQMKRGLAAVLGGAVSSGEVYTLMRPDGTAMKAIVSTSLIRKDGVIAGFRGTVVDITERIKLKEELEDSTKLLTGILQASPVGVFRLDATGHITFVNETFTRITGIPFGVIRGTYWAEILPPDDRQRVMERLEKTIRSRQMSGTESRYIHPDGTIHWLFGQTVPLIDKGDNLLGWVGTISDITEQKAIEMALKENEEKYRALTENTPDILFSTDMKGIITYASPQVNKYGFLVDEVVGKSLIILIHPADVSRVESSLSRELEKGAQFVSQFRIVDKWGTAYWFEEKSSLRLDVSGKPIGIYGILRDVSERKRTEDAIDIANKKLNLMNQITRHDILNTITGLLGCVDMAKASGDQAEQLQLLNEIKDLTRVIQRHITFTKEYQEVGVHLPQWQNVNTLIKKLLQNFERSGIVFSSDFENLEVYADPLLEKVFYNLVDNAIRYGVTLTSISIYPCISDRGLSLVFEDNGVGVDPGQKQEIFKRGVGKNTGMSLFLTAEILAITGITIEENGVFGKGARFEIAIPNGTWRFARG